MNIELESIEDDSDKILINGVTCLPQHFPRLAQFTNLKLLALVGCNISSLYGFPNIPTLTKLDLSFNRIKTTEHLIRARLPLKFLNMENNLISDFKAIEPLSTFPLLYLNLKDNPITGTEDYSEMVMSLIPTLKNLDNDSVSFTEVGKDVPVSVHSGKMPLKGLKRYGKGLGRKKTKYFEPEKTVKEVPKEEEYASESESEVSVSSYDEPAGDFDDDELDEEGELYEEDEEQLEEDFDDEFNTAEQAPSTDLPQNEDFEDGDAFSDTEVYLIQPNNKRKYQDNDDD